MAAWPGTFLHSGAVESGVWHHVAITLDNDTDEVQANAFALWLDGARIASGPAAQLPAHGGTIIGRDENTRYEDGPGKRPIVSSGGFLICGFIIGRSARLNWVNSQSTAPQQSLCAAPDPAPKSTVEALVLAWRQRLLRYAFIFHRTNTRG